MPLYMYQGAYRPATASLDGHKLTKINVHV
jgi:hypothetical protein